MTGKTVEITAADGGRFEAYIALPPSGSGPGMIVLQELFGVNQSLRDICELYAEEGYVALVPDLFWRIEAVVSFSDSEADVKEALRRYTGFDLDQGLKDIGDTLRALRQMAVCNGKVGVIGFGLGGKLAYLAAARCEVNAAVGYYGVGIESHLGEAASIRCPLVLHFGAEDQIVPESSRKRVASALAGQGEIEIYTYPGAGHRFAHQGAAVYNEPATSIAHSRSIGVFKRAIGPRYDLSAL